MRSAMRAPVAQSRRSPPSPLPRAGGRPKAGQAEPETGGARRGHSRGVAESRVHLPSGATGPIEVFVNGIRQHEGADFARGDGELVFTRRLANEGRLGFWRWTSIFFGV